MNMRILVTIATLLVSLTACDSLLPGSQPILESAIPEMKRTNSASAEVATVAPPTVGSLKPVVSATQSPAPTPTPELPTAILTPTQTDTPDGPTQNPTLTRTQILVLRPSATQALFGAQVGSPVGIPNFSHPDLGCDWMGLAGQVFDFDDAPMEELVVEVGGTLAGQPLFGLAITGQAEAYGPGGYEVWLGNEPVASGGTAWAQVFDMDGNAISSPTYFPTYAECQKNLILLNFAQAYLPPSDWAYLPLVYR